MSIIGIEAPGLDGLIADIAREGDRYKKEQKAALLASAKPVAAAVKRDAPRGRPKLTRADRSARKAQRLAGTRIEKRLYETVRTRVYDDPFSGAKVSVKATSPVAHLVILGTARHVEPKTGTASRPMPIGNGLFAMRVDNPGVSRRNDFQTRALVETESEAVAAYRATLFPPGAITR